MRHAIYTKQVQAVLDALRFNCSTCDEACAVLIATYFQLAQFSHAKGTTKEQIAEELSKAVLGMRMHPLQ
jgi:hypothetical protein